MDFCRDFLSWIFCRGFLSWIFGVDVCRGLFEPTNYFIFLIFLDGFFLAISIGGRTPPQAK